MRPRLDEQRRERDERADKAQVALRSIKRRPGASESEIRDELARAYEQHGIDPLPGELDLAASAIRSQTAPKEARELQPLRVLGRLVGNIAKPFRVDPDAASQGPGIKRHDDS